MSRHDVALDRVTGAPRRRRLQPQLAVRRHRPLLDAGRKAKDGRELRDRDRQRRKSARGPPREQHVGERSRRGRWRQPHLRRSAAALDHRRHRRRRRMFPRVSRRSCRRKEPDVFRGGVEETGLGIPCIQRVRRRDAGIRRPLGAHEQREIDEAMEESRQRRGRGGRHGRGYLGRRPPLAAAVENRAHQRVRRRSAANRVIDDLQSAALPVGDQVRRTTVAR